LSIEAISWAFKQTLTASEKLVLLVLADYCDDENKCWPKQETLADRTGLTRQTVNAKLGALETSGLIIREQRHHTSNITKLNIEHEPKTKTKPKRKTGSFTPPSLDAVREYAKGRNAESLAVGFHEYFTAGNWVDSRGNKVKNWKQKFLTWEKYSNDRSQKVGSRNNGTFTGASDYAAAAVKAGNG